MSLARAVLVTLLAAAGTHAALVQESGWLEVHTCAHREEEPYARGSNIVSDLSTSLDPFTAADDPFTTLNAVFARGFDGNLWGRWQVTTREGWGDWVQFGSPNGAGLRHAPSAVADVDGLIVVFAVANDGQIYYVRQDRNDIFGNWTQVTPIDANIAAGTKNLVLARSVDRRIFIYVESDGHVHQVNENSPGSSTWSGWTYNVFGDRRVLSKVTVEANTFTGYLEAFAILDDNCMYQAWQHKDQSWHDWYELWACWTQPKFNSNPVVHVMPGSVMNGILELFVRGTNNEIWHTWQTTCVTIDNPWSFCTWGAYYTLGGQSPAPQDGTFVDIFVSNNIHNGLEVFVTGADGNLYHTWQSEMWADWSSWTSLGRPERGPLTSQPFIVHDKSGWWMAYARGFDGELEIFVQQKSIQAVPRRIAYGEPVHLTWRIPVDEACADDWIAVYEPQAGNDQFLGFVYVNGELNPGDKPNPDGHYYYPLYLPDGLYEFRYLVNRKPLDVLRVLIKISGTSDLTPEEQLFNGITIGLGEKAWNFANCSTDLMATFDLFRTAFASFDNGDVYKGMNQLGEAIDDYGESMALCGNTAIATAIRTFARDLISCIMGACVKFVVSIVAEVIIVYLRIHEITKDIMAADNNMAIAAYEQSGVHIGDMIRAVIQVRPE